MFQNLFATIELDFFVRKMVFIRGLDSFSYGQK